MSVDGKWRIVVDSSAGTQQSDFEFKTDGSKVTGSCEWDGATLEILNGGFDGDRLKFAIKVKRPVPMKVTYTLTVSGDSMAGELKPGIFPKQPVSGFRS